MATIQKIPVLWTGLTGLPGYSLFYGENGVDATAEIKAFFNAIKDLCPSPLQWSVPSGGDTLDDATGTINGSWVGTGGGTVSATNGTIYAAGTGTWVAWGTDAIVAGRRLKGRTFICPLVTAGYDISGTINNTYLGTIGAAASTLASAGKLVVWHRPAPGGGGGGSSSLVTGYGTRDQVTSLKSRRT